MIYYFPNRPLLDVADPDSPADPSSDYLDSLEEEGRWLAEQKWNGDNCLVHINPDGSTEFWNRQKARLKYVPTPEVKDELSRWPKDSVINCELVHSKTKGVKNLLMVHTIMRWEGAWLRGHTWGQSRDILDGCIDWGLDQYHIRISRVWKRNFFQLFMDADGSIIEGIILKDPDGKLVFSATASGKGIEVPWMRKFRKPHARIGMF